MTRILAAIMAWDECECESISCSHRDAMVAIACETFAVIPGVRKATSVSGSLGSEYIDLTPDHDDAASVCVRLSNHRQTGSCWSMPVWSFEPRDTEADVRRGMEAIAAAVADEIEEAKERE